MTPFNRRLGFLVPLFFVLAIALVLPRGGHAPAQPVDPTERESLALLYADQGKSEVARALARGDADLASAVEERLAGLEPEPSEGGDDLARLEEARAAWHEGVGDRARTLLAELTNTSVATEARALALRIDVLESQVFSARTSCRAKPPTDDAGKAACALADWSVGNPVGARDALEPIVEATENPLALAVFALALHLLETDAEAQPYLDRAVELDPEDGFVLRVQGIFAPEEVDEELFAASRFAEPAAILYMSRSEDAREWEVAESLPLWVTATLNADSFDPSTSASVSIEPLVAELADPQLRWDAYRRIIWVHSLLGMGDSAQGWALAALDRHPEAVEAHEVVLNTLGTRNWMLSRTVAESLLVLDPDHATARWVLEHVEP